MDDLKTIFSNKLQSFRDNITAQDKIDAMNEIGISRPTLDKYLQGRPAKFDLATELIDFLSERVQQRLNRLEGSPLSVESKATATI